MSLFFFFFGPGKISPKINFQNSKKKSDFGGFQSPEIRKLNVKIDQKYRKMIEVFFF